MANFWRRISRILIENGWVIIREGKGSHQIWGNPEKPNHISVPSNLKSRHTANNILKQAGIPKSF
ncbi:MAG: type II toxin-antitoxin system HicA family toxin [Gammaproteobacteria bacterium]|nr:type II toxin-antitoxin system HicA family toxin [Gammaproteobacteria bacterium]MDE0509262.1 type II toxin-antitoxin system HicA family toxin [Gammaproteobacteria bacterium]MYC60893.1 type II toxin-antitoxin system HicA family toxin [Gammaproteobacteria bacterium]